MIVQKEWENEKSLKFPLFLLESSEKKTASNKIESLSRIVDNNYIPEDEESAGLHDAYISANQKKK